MTIRREGRFLLNADDSASTGIGTSIGLESSLLADCIREALNRGYPGVFGSSAYGFQEPWLDCLLALPELQRIWFWDVELANVEALYKLKKLREMGVEPKRPPIDFSRLPSLTSLVLNFHARDSGIESLRHLERLHIWHFKPASKSFAGFRLPEQLHELQINWANPTNLGGLPRIPTLRRLEIHRCRNLESLGELPGLFPNLEHLVVAACGRIPDGEGVRIASQIPSLRHAFVKDRKVV